MTNFCRSFPSQNRFFDWVEYFEHKSERKITRSTKIKWWLAPYYFGGRVKAEVWDRQNLDIDEFGHRKEYYCSFLQCVIVYAVLHYYRSGVTRENDPVMIEYLLYVIACASWVVHSCDVTHFECLDGCLVYSHAYLPDERSAFVAKILRDRFNWLEKYVYFIWASGWGYF